MVSTTLKNAAHSAAFCLLGMLSPNSPYAAAETGAAYPGTNVNPTIFPPSPLENEIRKTLLTHLRTPVDCFVEDKIKPLTDSLDDKGHKGKLRAGYITSGAETSVFLFLKPSVIKSDLIAASDWIPFPGNPIKSGHDKCVHDNSPCHSASSVPLKKFQRYLDAHNAVEPTMLPSSLEPEVRRILISRYSGFAEKYFQTKFRAGYTIKNGKPSLLLFFLSQNAASIFPGHDSTDAYRACVDQKPEFNSSIYIQPSIFNIPNLDNYLRSGTLAEVIHPFTGKTKISWHAGAVQPLTLEPVPKDAPLSRNHGLLWNNTSMADEQLFFGPDGIYVEFKNEVRRLQQGEYEPNYPTLLRGSSEHCDVLGRLFVYTPENAGVKRIMELKCSPAEWLAGVGEGVIKKYRSRINPKKTESHHTAYTAMEKEFADSLPAFTESGLEKFVDEWEEKKSIPSAEDEDEEVFQPYGNDEDEETDFHPYGEDSEIKEEAVWEQIVRGLYTGVLASVLTERNAKKSEPTRIHLNGNGGTFPYLLYYAHTLDEVTIKNFEGDNIAAHAASYGGSANSITLADITGDWAGANIAWNDGRVGTVTLANITGNVAGAYIAENNGHVGTVTLANIKGDEAGVYIAKNNGHVGTVTLANITGIGAGVYIAKNGRIDLLLAVKNKGMNYLLFNHATRTITSLDGLARADEIQALIDTLGQQDKAPEHYAAASKQLGELLRAEP